MSSETKSKVKKSTKSAAAKNKKGIVDHTFSGDLTLRRVAEVKDAMAKVVESAKIIRFSFEDVEEIDLSFVQALCSAHRTALDAGKILELTGDQPETFTNLLKESGLNVHVGCSLGVDLECPWLENKS